MEITGFDITEATTGISVLNKLGAVLSIKDTYGKEIASANRKLPSHTFPNASQPHNNRFM